MKLKRKKKSIAAQAMDALRKPVPPPGHAHETVKDYRRRPKYGKHHDLEDYGN
jgi:hypothetical protein